MLPRPKVAPKIEGRTKLRKYLQENYVTLTKDNDVSCRHHSPPHNKLLILSQQEEQALTGQSRPAPHNVAAGLDKHTFRAPLAPPHTDLLEADSERNNRVA